MLRTRLPLTLRLLKASVRLTCVKHAASVHPEPGSNSPLYFNFSLIPDSSIPNAIFPTTFQLLRFDLASLSSGSVCSTERAGLYHTFSPVSSSVFCSADSLFQRRKPPVHHRRRQRDPSTNLRKKAADCSLCPPRSQIFLTYSLTGLLYQFFFLCQVTLRDDLRAPASASPHPRTPDRRQPAGRAPGASCGFPAA